MDHRSPGPCPLGTTAVKSSNTSGHFGAEGSVELSGTDSAAQDDTSAAAGRAAAAGAGIGEVLA
jgi:hypothetical protein